MKKIPCRGHARRGGQGSIELEFVTPLSSLLERCFPQQQRSLPTTFRIYIYWRESDKKYGIILKLGSFWLFYECSALSTLNFILFDMLRVILPIFVTHYSSKGRYGLLAYSIRTHYDDEPVMHTYFSRQEGKVCWFDDQWKQLAVFSPSRIRSSPEQVAKEVLNKFRKALVLKKATKEMNPLARIVSNELLKGIF